MPLFVARPGAAPVGRQGRGACSHPRASGTSEEAISCAIGALGPAAREEGGWGAARDGPGCDAGRARLPATPLSLKPQAGVAVDAAQGAGASGAEALPDSAPNAGSPCPSSGAAESCEASGAACGAGGKTLDPKPGLPDAEPAPRGYAGCSEAGRSAARGSAAGRGSRAMDGRGSSHAPTANGTAASDGPSGQVRDDHNARSCSAAHVHGGAGAGMGAAAERLSPGSPDLEHSHPDATAHYGGPAAAAPGAAAPPPRACDSGLNRVLQACGLSCPALSIPVPVVQAEKLCCVQPRYHLYALAALLCREQTDVVPTIPCMNEHRCFKPNVVLAPRSTHARAGGSGC